MSARTELAAALAAALPDWLIISDARALDTVPRSTAVLWTSRINRPAKLGLDLLTTELTLWVLTPTSDPTRLEDALDVGLVDVMAALEPLQAFAWTEAERGTLADRFDGWRLSITCLNTITEE